MKLTKLMIAVVSLTAGSAFANAPVIANLTGASAMRDNQGLALGELCTKDADGNTKPGYFFKQFNSSDSNVRTYVCSTGSVIDTQAKYNAVIAGTDTTAAFAGFGSSAYSEVRQSVAGGSFTAVQGLAGVLPVENQKFYNPGTNAFELSAFSIGGYTDTEVAVAVIGNPAPDATETSVGVLQSFGVAVSRDLYNGMFAKQKAAGFIPSTCAETDFATPACVPSISKGQMASIMNGNPFSTAKSQGAAYLASGTPADAKLVYARRVDSSGTQAAATSYFLGNGCSPNPEALVAQPPQGTSEDQGLVTVQANAGTSDVRTALNVAPNASNPTYVIGVMSGENNTSGANWRWIRVGGAHMSESAQPGLSSNTNINTAINGGYDFVYESKAYYNEAANPGSELFFGELIAKSQSLTLPKGLVALPNANGFTRNGSACGVLTN
jgi:hypothetical protein